MGGAGQLEDRLTVAAVFNRRPVKQKSDDREIIAFLILKMEPANGLEPLTY